MTSPNDGEKRFAWDDIYEGLLLLGIPKPEESRIEGRRKRGHRTRVSEIYCPHAHLILNFHETLSPGEKIRFRKLYSRRVSPSESNVVILQDVKDLVMYLLVTPVSVQFINLFHLPITDRFLRALLVYFQYYVDTWEELARERAAAARKAPNPRAGGSRAARAGELRALAVALGREYAELLLGCGETAPYHHAAAGRRNPHTRVQSQGEKDLRIFEVLLGVAHRVVWVALQRKYYNPIEVELHRLFRTDAYNMANRRTGGLVNEAISENEVRILHGPEMPPRRKLLRISPLIHKVVHSDCDFRLLSLGLTDVETRDPRILYLRDALLAEEEALPELGIKIGILGQPRSDYDAMLVPSEGGEEILQDQDEGKGSIGEKRSSRSDRPRGSATRQGEREISRMPGFGEDSEVSSEFPGEAADSNCRGHDAAREASRRKWIARELERRRNERWDLSSLGTSLERRVDRSNEATSF